MDLFVSHMLSHLEGLIDIFVFAPHSEGLTAVEIFVLPRAFALGSDDGRGYLRVTTCICTWKEWSISSFLATHLVGLTTVEIFVSPRAVILGRAD